MYMGIFDSLPSEWLSRYKDSSLKTMESLILRVQRDNGLVDDKLYDQLLSRPDKVKQYALGQKSVSRQKDILNVFRQVSAGRYGYDSTVVKWYDEILASMRPLFDLARAEAEAARMKRD